MGTSDVFKVLKIAPAAGECNLKTLKALRLNTYHEMHERSFDFFVYNILNKIIKESIFGTYFSVKHLYLFIEIFVLVLLQFRIEFSFICLFFSEIPPRLYLFSRVFVLFFGFSFSWSTTMSYNKANRLSAILLIVFKFRASPRVSITVI